MACATPPRESSNLRHLPPELIPGTALLEARVQFAELRLRADLAAELLAIGSFPTEGELDRMIEAIPRDIYYQLVAKRT